MIVEGVTTQWSVDPEGYRWVEAPDDGQPVLVPNSMKRDPRTARLYPIAPMKFPALFDKLARTQPTQSGILSFANRFGSLGIPRRYIDTGVGAEEKGGVRYGSFFIEGESLSDWCREIDSMTLACRCWTALRQSDYAELEQLEVLLREDATRVLIRPSSLSPVSDALQLLFSSGLRNGISGHLESREGGEGFELRFRPNSLIAAIWLQFGQAVANGEWRDCRHCGRPFKPKRKDQKHCKESCRQMAYQKRKAREPR